MEKHITLTKTSLYFSGYFRVKVALLISLLLIFISTRDSLLVLVKNAKFYTSLCFGFVIAWLIIELIHWVNVWLDGFCPWHALLKRLCLLLLFGIMPVVLIDLLLVKLVFIFAHQNFDRSGFTRKILPLNVLLICIGHFSLYLRQRHQLKSNAGAMRTSGNGNTPGLQTFALVTGYLSNQKHELLPDEILCLITGSSYGDIFLKNGKRMNMTYRRHTLRAKLDPKKFVETRGGVFFAYDAISGLRKAGRQHQLILKQDFHFDGIPLDISRRFFPAFLEGFKAWQTG
ncbi:hypothetical protein [Pedobacter aquatilis]|uniref:hypothetical protein n=1 Tax=Pedobacter aquatilis TaxID=351343 RepID=UPI00292F47CC|nr:hypothetical protein [Pedobacter aquatilis]